MTTKINIACLRQGQAFSFEYVQKLYSSLRRNSTIGFDFYLLTDQPQLDSWMFPLYTNGFDMPKWWGKLLLFDPKFRPTGTTIYFDLDTIILRNIDDIISEATKHDFLILENFLQPPVRSDRAPKDKYGSAVMSFSNNYGIQVWEKFNASKHEHMRQFERSGDQGFIEYAEPNAITWQSLWPLEPNKFRSVKYPVSLIETGPPKDCSVLCFHGVPKPHSVSTLPWMQTHWR